MKKIDIREEIEAYRRREQERKDATPYKIITTCWEDGIYILDWTWKKFWVLKQYRFWWYNLYGDAIFNLQNIYIPCKF